MNAQTRLYWLLLDAKREATGNPIIRLYYLIRMKLLEREHGNANH